MLTLRQLGTVCRMNHFWRDVYVRQNYLFRKTEKVKMYLFDTYIFTYVFLMYNGYIYNHK